MDKKMKAAIAGVMAFLSEEKTAVSVPLPVRPALVPWSINAIQTTMQNRALVQRRVVKR